MNQDLRKKWRMDDATKALKEAGFSLERTNESFKCFGIRNEHIGMKTRSWLEMMSILELWVIIQKAKLQKQGVKTDATKRD